jgi:CubicO group peptidase (beta-lactamase class C family)
MNSERRTQNAELRKDSFLHSAFCVLRSEFLLFSLLLSLPLSAAPPGPIFRPGGPDAAKYGQAAGYPKGPAVHDDVPEYIVGASSHFDELFPTHKVAHAAKPWAFKRAAVPLEVSYEVRGRKSTLGEFFDHLPVTGLLIIKDDTILTEVYQYARTDHDRFNGASMTKTVVSMLMGIAVEERRIKSIDDKAAAYVPSLKESAYGETSLRALLSMSSGVTLDEDTFWTDVFTPKEDTGASLAKDGKRTAAPGTQFKYSSGDSEVLTTVLRHTFGVPLAQVLSERIWQPIGAESDASWAAESSDQEIGPWGFNAVLRDYGRFGRLLAWDGAWNGKQLIPRAWVLAATTIRPEDKQVAPGTASHTYGYGYQVWILPGERREFVLIGANGQYVFVDPKSKLVMVQTAVRLDGEAVTSRYNETLALWQALVRDLG